MSHSGGSPGPGRLSWTRLPAAAPFRSKPCALGRTPSPATSTPSPSCSTRSSSNTSPNTDSALPMKFANGASGSGAKPRRSWPSSTQGTRMGRRLSPISGQGRSFQKLPKSMSILSKFHSCVRCGSRNKAAATEPSVGCEVHRCQALTDTIEMTQADGTIRKVRRPRLEDFRSEEAKRSLSKERLHEGLRLAL